MSRRQSLPAQSERLESRCLLSLPAGAETPWTPQPIKQQHSDAVIATQADGDYFAAWVKADGSGGCSIFAEEFDASNTAKAPAFVVTTSADHLFEVQAASVNSNNDLLIAWRQWVSPFQYNFFVRRFDGSGNAIADPLLITDTHIANEDGCYTTINADGSSLIQWYTGGSFVGGLSELYAQVIDAAGEPVGDDLLINDATAQGSGATVRVDGNDEFLVVWQTGPKYFIGSGDSYARRVHASDAAMDPAFRIFQSPSHNFSSPNIAMTPDGGFIAAAFDDGIYAIRYSAEGNVIGSEFLVYPTASQNQSDRFPIVAINSAGDFVIGWHHAEYFNNMPTKYGFYARRYDANSSPVGSAFAVNATPWTEYYYMRKLSLGDTGDLVGIWYTNPGLRTRTLELNAPMSEKILVQGTAGNDVISLKFTDQELFLTINNESAYYNAAAYSRIDILGGDGNDVIKITGNVGVYVLAGLGNDSLTGGDGNDTLGGEAGNDKIASGIGNNSVSGGDGDDTITCGENDDTIRGGRGNDSIKGISGNNVIYGAQGNDTIHGGYGNDRVYGQDGNDRLYGDQGDDTLRGGNGKDNLRGGIGTNAFFGEAGNDTIIVSSDYFPDQCNGGPGRDSIQGLRSDDVIKLIEFEIQ